MARSTRFILALVIFCAVPATALAQGMFLDGDQNGFALQGLVGGNDDYDAHGASVSFANQGTLDLGLSFVRSKAKEATSLGTLETTEIAPFLAWGLSRPDEETIWGSEIRVAYIWSRVSSDQDSDLLMTAEMDISTLQTGAAGYAELNFHRNFRVMPEGGVYFLMSWIDPEGYVDSFTESDIMLNFNLHLVFGKKDDGPKIVLSPGYQLMDEDNAWSATLSFVFPKSSKPKTGRGS